MLVHFYHIFADGTFEVPVTHHVKTLKESGLLAELDSVRVGIVGSEENRSLVLELLEELDIPFTVSATAATGWEQVTLRKLHRFAKEEDAKILYAHTKGAYSQTRLARDWRVSMTYDTVTRWEECVAALDIVEAAGAFWLESNDPEHDEHHYFFAGNFWWARTDYLRRLPALKNKTRFQAEGWVGLRSPSVRIMRRGNSYFGNFWEPNEKT